MKDSSAKPAGRRTFQVLHVRNFRLYFLGQICSTSGNNAQTVALGWLVLEVTQSPTYLGVVTAVQYVPVLLLAPFLGAVVDRYDKRRILMITQGCGLLVAVFLWVLSFAGWATGPDIGVLAFVLGVVKALDNPTRQAFIREIAGTELLANGVALDNVLTGVARIVGPAIAGLVIAIAGISECFFVNAGSFVVLFAALCAIRTADCSIRTNLADRPTLRSGFRYVLRTPEVLLGLTVMMLVGTFTYEFWVTFPVLLRNVFRQNASGYAEFMAVMSVGSVAGGLAIARRHCVGRADLFAATAAFGATTALVGLSSSLGFAFAAVLLMGAAYSAFVALSNSVLQLNTDPAYQGRVMALWTAAFLGSTAIGGPIMGWMADRYGARTAIVVGGTVAVATAAGAALRSVVKTEAVGVDENRSSETT